MKDRQRDFLDLTEAQKNRFLASLSHELTIVAREAYEVGAEALTDQVWVRRVNEIQHRVTGHLVKLLRDDNARYPDDVLVNIILGSEGDNLKRAIELAFDRALRGAT